MDMSFDFRKEVGQVPFNHPRADISELSIISLVSPTASTAWSGFPTISSAIDFKRTEGLGDDWRIRDRRDSDQRKDVYGESLLVIGSMIHDHIRHLVSTYGPVENIDITVRREMMSYAAGLIEEITRISDRDIGTWRGMRGKFVTSFGKERAHAWLEDVDGNILDILPWNPDVNCVAYHAAGSEAHGHFQGYSALRKAYGTATDAVLRGDLERSGSAIGMAEFARLHARLGNHIVASVSRSHLPLLAVS